MTQPVRTTQGQINNFFSQYSQIDRLLPAVDIARGSMKIENNPIK